MSEGEDGRPASQAGDPGARLARYERLDGERVAATIERLGGRIADRFPNAGLHQVCTRLHGIALDAHERAEAIARPIVPLRLAIVGVVALLVVALPLPFLLVGTAEESVGRYELIGVIEAAIQDVVFIGAAIFFLLTLEARIKRRRALAALHELRSIAHIIDMLQLTKDPERVLRRGPSTARSPAFAMTAFELGRYLDYASEMLALTGKIGALYVETFDDPVLLGAVNEIETLTTGLSRKIWQKLVVLNAIWDDGS